ncbi:MAG: SusD/RagB family nutrient-binding outer membrane lipoprotein [Flavobacteriaceae bacterium]|nr:SusD/RagB family nutrient-binding outer membrane lipoprotein [Flavobacteriaceae bacterium]
MNTYYKIIGIALIGLMTLTSCDSGLEELNINPNEPEVVPSHTIFNRATKRVMDNTRDGWMGGRMIHPWVQYTAQINYVEEDIYQYRPASAQTGWDQLYFAANNFKKIIDLVEDPATAIMMEASGNPQNQIAASRVMLTYTFLMLVEHFGDVPYYSYGTVDPDFQALQLNNGYLNPKYATQDKIYADMIKELGEASSQFVLGESVFVSGDPIYQGDAAKWKKFANSLRLRIANRVKHVLPSAQAAMNEAVVAGVFESNQDNAALHYGTAALEGNPLWRAFFVENRTDFAVNDQFIQLLQGVNGDYGEDPRLQQMAAPINTRIADVGNGNYTPSDNVFDYQGMPYGLPETRISANNNQNNLSFFSSSILSPSHPEMLMEFAEVQFILSEMNGWSQANYEEGVRASMERWGVAESKIVSYISSLPAANQEHVITQKYIALFLQSQEAWSEYRRTGYPDTDILLLPGEIGTEINGATYTFVPLEDIDDIPYRVRYPLGEHSFNGENYQQAINRLNHLDNLHSKLWWMP